VEGGTNPGRLYAINDDTGNIVWSYEFSTQTPVINISVPGTGSHSGSGPSVDPDAGTDGIVWCPNGDRLYAIDLSNGDELYVKNLNDWAMGQTPSWDANNVYICDDAGNLTAYVKNTGAKAWELSLGGPIRTSPIYDANGNMYTVWNGFGPERGYVVCINMTTREIVWEQPLGGWVLLSMAADDGVIYVGDADVTTPPFYSHLYAIGPKDVDVDLQVERIVASGLKEDEPGYLVAQLYNDGTASAWDFEVKFYRGDPDQGGSLIGTIEVPRARPGESTPAVIPWAPTASGDLDIFAVADSADDVDETIEGNNKGFGTVPVISGDASPTAVIDSISPDDVYADGTNITFSGSASDVDGTVDSYMWHSHIDGYLSGEEDFAVLSDVLTPGAHVITFRVQDDDGLMSDNATAVLIVRSVPGDDWNRSGHDNENTGYSTSGSVMVPTIEWYTSYETLTGETALASPVVVDGVAYVCTLNTTYAFDADDGSEIWNHTMPDDWFWGQAATPAVSVEHGVIAVTGFDIIVLDIEDGSEVWSLDMVGDFELAGPLIYGDLLFVHSLGYQNITCFDLTTGSEQWNYEVGAGYLWSSPSIGFGHLYVTSYSTPDDLEGYYAIYGLNLSDGLLDWRWRLGDGSVGGIGIPFVGAALSISSPTVCSYQGIDMVIVADITGNVYAFEPDGEQPRDFIDSDGSGPTPIDGAQDDGEIIWQTDLAEDTIASTSYHDGRVFVVTWLGTLACLDASDGGTLWTTDIGMPFWGAPTINNDTLYLAGIDSYLYCFGSSDGSLIWRHLTRPYTFIYSSPTLYGDSMFVTGGYGPWLMWTDGVYRIGPYVDTPDLAVSDDLIILEDPSPVDGDLVEVMVGVVNHGSADAVGSVALFHDDPTWSNLIGYGTVEVRAGGTGGIAFAWNTTGMYGDRELIAWIECDGDPISHNDAT
ncbi:MAG: PQQ-binding-like beta-propeller repeat protein, partial [Thermoplasmata archaeon]|nr:PQQ-binding-like beta-propeller repeat protein [Thermoplasmata archaeon]